MNPGATLVARTRGEKPESPEPSKGSKGIRPVAIQVRGWPEWKEWVERLRVYAAGKLGVPISFNTLVGLALAHYARAIGFKENPPER